MIDSDILLPVLDAAAHRRAERRRFLRAAGSAAVAAGALPLLSACGDSGTTLTDTSTPTPTPTPTSTSAVADADVLNFAIQLEYLEANFYAFATTGSGISTSLLSGTGTAGSATGGRAVDFSGDAIVGQYAREIAADELAHVAFLRSAIGTSVVAQPTIDLSPGGAFSAAARAAGVIGAGDTFDPYASPENFLLGAFIFEDVGVTAYKGASILITSSIYLNAAAGILSAEAYHAGLIRTSLYRKGIATPTLRTNADKISDARDSLDGPTDLDQGISGTGTVSNLSPADANGIAFSRTPGQVLNIVYLNSAAVVGGGFFPSGLNGNVKTSAASA